jgi:hypothetical protein
MGDKDAADDFSIDVTQMVELPTLLEPLSGEQLLVAAAAAGVDVPGDIHRVVVALPPYSVSPCNEAKTVTSSQSGTQIG